MSELPPPETIRRAMRISTVIAILCAILAIAFPEGRVPLGAVAIVFAGLALMGGRNLKRAQQTRVVVPPASDGEAMFATLAMLDIPINTGESDPLSALKLGAAKAAVYHGYRLLMSGREEEAMTTLEHVATSSHGRISAAAHYLIGKAHEAAARREQARASYRAALSIAADYTLAAAALDKVDL